VLKRVFLQLPALAARAAWTRIRHHVGNEIPAVEVTAVTVAALKL
jgi:hypothetical protein